MCLVFDLHLRYHFSRLVAVQNRTIRSTGRHVWVVMLIEQKMEKTHLIWNQSYVRLQEKQNLYKTRIKKEIKKCKGMVQLA